MTEKHSTQTVTTAQQCADGAVGVSRDNWYVAVVNSRHEKSVAEKLQKMGIDSYVATQNEIHLWSNGRRKMVDRVVIPSTVFVRCSEKMRRQIVSFPFILRFVVNRSVDSSNLNKPVAVIPNEQIERLRFMLGQDEVPVNFVPTMFKTKDSVVVIRGHFKGLRGEIMENSDGTHNLLVSISMLGGATVTIDPKDVELITDTTI